MDIRVQLARMEGKQDVANERLKQLSRAISWTSARRSTRTPIVSGCSKPTRTSEAGSARVWRLAGGYYGQSSERFQSEQSHSRWDRRRARQILPAIFDQHAAPAGPLPRPNLPRDRRLPLPQGNLGTDARAEALRGPRGLGQRPSRRWAAVLRPRPVPAHRTGQLRPHRRGAGAPAGRSSRNWPPTRRSGSRSPATTGWSTASINRRTRTTIGPYLHVDCGGFIKGSDYEATGYARGAPFRTTVNVTDTGVSRGGLEALVGIFTFIPGQSGGPVVDSGSGYVVGTVNTYDAEDGVSGSVELKGTPVCDTGVA
jgi:hypothetical protein